jgi:hypothetical protein
MTKKYKCVHGDLCKYGTSSIPVTKGFPRRCKHYKEHENCSRHLLGKGSCNHLRIAGEYGFNTDEIEAMHSICKVQDG